jgi:hypothetical protein
MCRFITVKIVRDDTCQSVKAESSQPTASSVRVVAQLFLLFSISRPAHKSRLVCFHLVFCHPSGWHSFNGAQQHAIPFIPAETEDVATDENCRRLFHFSSLRSDIFRRQECHLRAESNCHRPTVSLASKFAHNSKTDFFLLGVKGIPTGQMIRIFLCSPLAASD